MYDGAEEALESILRIVEKCPAPYKEKCFEVLLKGYVDQQIGFLPKGSGTKNEPPPRDSRGGDDPGTLGVELPPEVDRRLRALAKRLEVSAADFLDVFDFTSTDHAYHPLDIPGGNNAVRTRNAALLVAARTFLLTGTWRADWGEIRALCVDVNCYDSPNHSKYLRSGAGEIFRSVDPGSPVELTGPGRQQAEELVKQLIPSVA